MAWEWEWGMVRHSAFRNGQIRSGAGLAVRSSVAITLAGWVAKCYLRSMSQPVKLSDALVLDARLAAEVMERSIAGQVEFWARLGRAIEPLLAGRDAMVLARNAASRPISECLTSADSPAGRQRVVDFLQSQPFPHYEAHPTERGLLVRIGADGKRTTGRFVNREFQPVTTKRKLV
jgi:hypothetical protein